MKMIWYTVLLLNLNLAYADTIQLRNYTPHDVLLVRTKTGGNGCSRGQNSHRLQHKQAELIMHSTSCPITQIILPKAFAIHTEQVIDVPAGAIPDRDCTIDIKQSATGYKIAVY